MIIKNWKTTAAGFAGAVLTLLANGVNLKSAVMASTLALLGSLSKDHDITGGTRTK